MNWKNWRGWAALGAIFMMVIGVFQIISGIWGLFNDQWIVQGYNGYFMVDVTGLAIWYIVIGVVLVLGGIAVIQGSAFGRIVGIVAVSLGIISQLFQLPVHPVWSILLIGMFVMALIGFVVVREPLESEYYEEEEVAIAPAGPVAAAAPVEAEPVAAPAAAPVAPPVEPEPVAPPAWEPPAAPPVEAAPAAPAAEAPAAPPVENPPASEPGQTV